MKVVSLYFMIILGVVISPRSLYAYVGDKSYTKEAIDAALDRIKFTPLSRAEALEKLKKQGIQFEAVEIFSTENLNSIFAAISLLPSEFHAFFPMLMIGSYDIADENGMYEYVPGVNESGSSKIKLTKKWIMQPAYSQIGIFVHELGHLYGTIFADVQSSNLWRNVDCGWTLEYGIFWDPKCHEVHVSQYSKQNPREDWAESFVVYILDSDRLKQASTKKYQLLSTILSVDPEFSKKFKIGSLLKRNHRKELSEQPLNKKCRETFGKLYKDECLVISMIDNPNIRSVISKSLQDDIFMVFASAYKKLNSPMLSPNH